MSRQIELIDLTQDEPVISYVNRPVLSDLTAEQASKKKGTRGRRRQGKENQTIERANRANNVTRNTMEGLGTKQNPWISHVKSFAKQNNISYRDALRSRATKSAYVKGGNIFNPVDAFKSGYKFGYKTLGPALLGKK